MEEELQGLQKRLTEMLLEFDGFCKKNGLQYFLAGGSALGAYRHQGFIPWDDDVDLAMLRSDFERMEDLLREECQNELESCVYSPVDAHLLPDAPIGYLFDKGAKKRDYRESAKIDIHPIDGVPESSREQRLQNILSKVYYLLVYEHPTKNKGRFMHLATGLILAVTPSRPRAFYRRKLKVFLTKWDDRTSRKVCSLFGLAGYRREVMPREWIFPMQQMTFAGHSLPVPGDMEYYLERLYGDFRRIPPEEERIPKHDTYRYYPLEKDSRG